MKILVNGLLFVLCISSAIAQEVKTSHFTINLPDELVVEASDNKVLAFGKNGPQKQPYHFLSIEFGEDLIAERVTTSINKTLGKMEKGKKLERVECDNSCSAYFASVAKSKKDKPTISNLFYVIKGKQVTTVISYSTENNSNEAKVLIDKIADKIKQGSLDP